MGCGINASMARLARVRVVSYGSAFLLLLGVAVWIALKVDDDLVRPLGGDVLVIPLLHCLLCAITTAPPSLVALGVYLFACAIEVGQAFDLVTMLHLQDCPVMRVAIGTVFDPRDIVAYALGYGLTLLVEWARRRAFRPRAS